jgi:hypothetical protein
METIEDKNPDPRSIEIVHGKNNSCENILRISSEAAQGTKLIACSLAPHLRWPKFTLTFTYPGGSNPSLHTDYMR